MLKQFSLVIIFTVILPLHAMLQQYQPPCENPLIQYGTALASAPQYSGRDGAIYRRIMLNEQEHYIRYEVVRCINKVHGQDLVDKFCLKPFKGPEEGKAALKECLRVMIPDRNRRDSNDVYCAEEPWVDGTKKTIRMYRSQRIRCASYADGCETEWNPETFFAIEETIYQNKESSRVRRIVLSEVQSNNVPTFELVGIDVDTAEDDYYSLFNELLKFMKQKGCRNRNNIDDKFSITVPATSDPAHSSYNTQNKIFSADFLKAIGFEQQEDRSVLTLERHLSFLENLREDILWFVDMLNNG